MYVEQLNNDVFNTLIYFNTSQHAFELQGSFDIGFPGEIRKFISQIYFICIKNSCILALRC